MTWRQEVSHATDIAILDVGSLGAYQVLMVTCEHNDPCFIACAKSFAAWESDGSYDEDRIFEKRNMATAEHCETSMTRTA